MTALEEDQSRANFWQRWYAPLLLTLWVLVPELRRLVDWQVGFNSLSVINLIPIIALVPLIPICLRPKEAKFSTDFLAVVSLWLVGFGYALLVGYLSGSVFSAAYEFGQFCLPLLFGVWVAAMRPALARQTLERFVTAALWLGFVTSVYGIFQFVAPPPWDVAWVQNSGLESIGSPVPFGLRIFGTLNSPGIYAAFLTLTILLALYRLRANRLWLIVPLFACSAALILTFYRTAWLELAVGLVVYLLLSPRRAMALGVLGATAVLTVVLAMNLSLITGDPTSNNQVQQRIATLNDLGNDASASARVDETNNAMREALAEPLGQGIGAVGTTTKLSAAAATTVLDNGYLTRFLEMGIFEVACYLASLLVALGLSVSRLREAAAAADNDTIALVATSIAIQVALAAAELSGDQHYALTGLVFWLVTGFTSTLGVRRMRGRLYEAGSEPAWNRAARA